MKRKKKRWLRHGSINYLSKQIIQNRCSNLEWWQPTESSRRKWIATKPKILILDEPTRGVDVGAKYEIYEIINELKKSGVAIIMISSDLPEVLSMSDRIAVMHEGDLMEC